MLDLHCHILPGVDDGAVDLPDALELARDALATGVRAVFATSHLWEKLFDTSPEHNYAEWKHLVRELKRADIPLEVFPGAENYLASDVSAAEFAKKAVPLGENGKHVLFDFSLRQMPPHVGDAVDALARRGLTAVIAHPERNADLQRDPRPVADWIARGALIQINAPSLVGIHGEAPATAAADLLERGAGHLLASDAHHRRRRPFCLDRGREIAARIVGAEEAKRMCEDRPWAIARGEDVDVPRDVNLESRARGARFLRKLFDS
ncbi:MAG: CpsB/CapC family capsule biosynthesis tyrosine phosphatase [bacterium]